MRASYSPIGMEISIKVELSELSSRDKASLFNQLMHDLGITKRIEPKMLDERVWRIITEQTNKAWEGQRS